MISVTSSATATRDREVPSPDSYCNRLLLIIITKGDGTPMDASSILEEDIIEICIWRAHTHPLGVLQYSTAESVVLIANLEDVNHIHHNLLDMTELCNEAVTVWTMALAEAHIAAFTAMWHSNQTTGDGEPHTPPYQTPPSEETPCCLHAQLGDLNDSELYQLIKDLAQEIAQCKLIMPPSNPPPHDWAHSLGSREPEEDDREVTFPGGGRWGPERQTTSVPHSPAGGRVPSGPPQQSPCPALAGPDMGQLITALTSGLQISTPKISTFSGDMAPSKTEVSYEQWSHKVQCIKDHYPESVVRESIMQSLRGAVADMVLLYGPYCWCIWNFRETFHNIWYGCIIWHINAKFLQNLAR